MSDVCSLNEGIVFAGLKKQVNRQIKEKLVVPCMTGSDHIHVTWSNLRHRLTNKETIWLLS